MRAPNVTAVFAIAVFSFSLQAFAAGPPVGRLVTFGASLSDTGNSFVWLSDTANASCGTMQNVPPYDALDDLLIPDGPYAAGGHHYTNGATWIEGVARYLALTGNARPAFQSDSPKASNYAVGGARAVADFPCRFNLPDQTTAYLNEFPETAPDTLVAIEIGGNDVRDALVAGNGGPIQAALLSLQQSLSMLYANGARRFLLLNVPDVGKTPAVRILDFLYPGTAAAADQLSQAYNLGLLALVQGISSLPGIDVRIVDIYTALNAIVADPAAYGFTNATDACVSPDHAPFRCAQPDRYVFWDGIHPTKATHAIIAQRAIEALSAP